MRYAGHGGRCCGIQHIYNFNEDQETSHDLAWCIRHHDGLPNRVLEAVLNDDQIAEHEPDLIANGFVKVARWLNGNSGNFCNAYYRYKPHRGRGEIEFYGQAVAEIYQPHELPTPPAPPPVTVVGTEYYVVRRDGRKCGPFLSPLAAKQAWPNCATFVGREMLSNGHTRWLAEEQFA